jgi:hypothetical protein
MYVMLEAFKNVILAYALRGDVQGLFTFVPGKNKVDKAVWESILKQHSKAFIAHYSTLLHAFDTRFDTGTKDHLNDYSEEEMLEIVAHARRPEFLEYLLQVERERILDFAPRPAVIDAILAKMPVKEYDPAELDALGEQFSNYHAVS